MTTNKTPVQEMLASLGIEALNTMQLEMQKTMAQPGDVVLLSPTGSGKTLAFLLPLLGLLELQTKTVQALILVPSRELGLQIETVFKSLKSDFKVNCFYGGHPFKMERNSLSMPPALLIGTPGRIADHLDKQTFSVASIKTIIFDEFDKSLEFGFTAEMKAILEQLPHIQKRVLTSATQAITVPDFVDLSNPTTLDYIAFATQSEGLDIKLVHSDDVDKLNVFLDLIHSFPTHETVIVFCNHRTSVDRICGHLEANNIVCDSFHGGLDQEQREQALAKFRNGSVSVLVTTDLAARGIDISGIKHIVHYQMSATEETFIHRNGRTARMGAAGTAYLILTQKEEKPAYIEMSAQNFVPKSNEGLYQAPKWITLRLMRGKKDKVNKMDVVGFLSKVGMLQRDELGVVEVKDFMSFAAVDRTKLDTVLDNISNQKIKGKVVKVEVV